MKQNQVSTTLFTDEHIPNPILEKYITMNHGNHNDTILTKEKDMAIIPYTSLDITQTQSNINSPLSKTSRRASTYSSYSGT